MRHGSLTLPLEDAALVERALADDETAFTAIYLKHARYVAAVAYQLLGNDGEVDDVVQDTFVIAHEGLPDLEEPAAIRRWLVVIAIRRVHRMLGRRRLRSWFVHRLFELSPRASDPRDAVSAEELYDTLDRMPPKLRVPWILTRVGAMSLEHAADVCEVSIATIKRRIAEADARIERSLSR